jgi:hypothetical protein
MNAIIRFCDGYGLVDCLGAIMALLCLFILAWMALDNLYIESAWFRRQWSKTGVGFPHTSFSPYFKRRA